MNKIYPRKEARIPFTKDGYQKILSEKAKLLSERPEAVEHLRKSREMGDLSENGYYKASRARLSFLDARLRRVDRLIKLGIIVESIRSGSVDIGSHVTITDGIKQMKYSIVGGYESDPSTQTISHLSPLGKALIGKKANDVVAVQTPSGPKSYTILAVNR
ncbi:transcription elongation factor GreA [Candidatus Gottesmanbacteria bacterium]|nr:transcription elongation factor GreA [Candidatus Gottesmanbacteria bacterium]